ncbi:MAG: hypothetical protein GXP31_15515 [Kiritimatiellaeota bacterium]|nr:hypothetical protein [Kiritimatiellota bacterium]
METRCFLASCLLGASVFAANAPNLVRNGGFEASDEHGVPLHWTKASGFAAALTTTEAPRNGRRSGRIPGDGKQYCWRQTIAAPSTRLYRATGWFRANGVTEAPGERDFARFYFHILYKDRPYAEATQTWVDIPSGTYDWRRFALLLTPRTEYPIDQIWVTVAGKFRSGALEFDDISLRPAEADGGFAAIEWARSADAVVLRDMSRVEPRTALARRATKGKWKLIPYESGGHDGTMVWASPETGAPEISLPLGVKGWHAVFVGIPAPSGLTKRVLLRLDNDPAFVPRARVSGAIEEVFFKTADLTGRTLRIAQRDSSKCQAAGVAYVKLIPLTEAEQARVQAGRADPALRRLVTSIDGFSYIYNRRPTSRSALLQEVEVYRNTDFKILMLQMGGADMVNYPSRFGEMRGQDLDDFARPGDRSYAEAIRILAEKGINPTQVLIEGAHDAGMTVYVSIRPGAWKHTPPLDDFFGSRFYEQHPEWRCRDRQGNDVARMSFAVPQVRALLVDVLREAVAFGADGACIIYVRGVPFVLFEKPFVDLFRKRHGLDPRSLEDDDPRIRALRCELMTQFMREVRKMLDEEGERRGVRLRQAAYVLATEADNLRFGLDVAAWCRDGLVDVLCPYAGAGGARTRAYDMAFFKRVCAPNKVRVYPTFVAWQLSNMEKMVKDALRLYAAGADGLSFWDGNSVAARMDRWAVVSRMGHESEMQRRLEDGLAKPVTARFHRLGGYVMDGPFSPNWGF